MRRRPRFRLPAARQTEDPGVQRLAPAKINLFLHVGDRRADGYHDLFSLVVFASCGDSIQAVAAPVTQLRVSGPHAAGLDAGPSNLVLRAEAALRHGQTPEACKQVKRCSRPLVSVRAAGRALSSRKKPWRRRACLPARRRNAHVGRWRASGPRTRAAGVCDGAGQPARRGRNASGIRRPPGSHRSARVGPAATLPVAARVYGLSRSHLKRSGITRQAHRPGDPARRTGPDRHAGLPARPHVGQWRNLFRNLSGRSSRRPRSGCIACKAARLVDRRDVLLDA